MGIFAWIVVGAIAGFVATLIAGGHEGIVGTVVLGILGGLLGGWVATSVLKLSGGGVNGINLESVVIAIAGALALIVVWRALTSRTSGRLRI